MPFGDHDDRVRAYVDDLFAPEDDVLAGWIEEAQRAGLPMIQVSPSVGKLLQVLVKAAGTRKALEIGTLGGYSGTWIARGLPDDGRLITLEIEPKHADFAQSIFDRAGVASKVEIRRGAAQDLLPTLHSEAPFDFIFIDCDQPHYPDHLEWALKLARPGTIIAGDNTLGGFRCMEARPEERRADDIGMQAFNERMATDPRLTSILVPMRDGVNVGVVNG